MSHPSRYVTPLKVCHSIKGIKICVLRNEIKKVANHEQYDVKFFNDLTGMPPILLVGVDRF